MKNIFVIFLFAIQCNFATAQNLPAYPGAFCAAREVFSTAKPDIIANFTGFTKLNSVWILNCNKLISHLLTRKNQLPVVNSNETICQLPYSFDACFRYQPRHIRKTLGQSALRINKNIPYLSSRMGNTISTSSNNTITRS